MSHKFLETESPAWVAEGIITEVQRARLLARYEIGKTAGTKNLKQPGQKKRLKNG